MAIVTITSGTQFDLSYWSAKPKPRYPHPLDGIEAKIARANEHIAEIIAINYAFARSHRVVREMEANGADEVVKLVISPLPDKLPLLVSETVFHLRSALDHIIAALDAKGKARFPFAGDRDKFVGSKTQGKIKNIFPFARNLVNRLKPYHDGGCKLLCAMNDLRNDDTHARLVALALSGPAWSDATINALIPWTSEGRARIEITYPVAFENEIVLARCFQGAKLNYNSEPMIEIAFSDIEALEGKSVVTSLQQMADLSTRIIRILANRFF